VYDALNVLIAVGVIIKKKKFLVATDETFKSGKYQSVKFRDVTTRRSGRKSKRTKKIEPRKSAHFYSRNNTSWT
jgi:hypothetical protein